MRIRTRGSGDPVVAVIGGIHGDEPAGVEVVDRLSSYSLDLDGTLVLITANEEAIESDDRYTETDLNRSFPGNAESQYYEERLAADLTEELEGVDAVLAIHTSRSAPPAFAMYADLNPITRRSLTGMPVEYAVETTGVNEGSLVSQNPKAVTIEAGRQRDVMAAEVGTVAALDFLRTHGVLVDAPPFQTSVRKVNALSCFEKGKGEPQLHYRNFQRIPSDEVIAEDDEYVHRVGGDGDATVVLASEDGYDDIYGILAEFDGIIEP